MTDDLVKRPVLRIYTEATSDKGGIWAFKPYTSAHTVFVEESNYLDLKDRIEALTAERDRAEDELYELQQTCITLRGENEALTAERDRLKAFVVSQGAQMQRQSEAAEVERDRLREALTELLEVSRRAVRLSVECDNFKLYAMEPMERAILLSRYALKGESHD